MITIDSGNKSVIITNSTGDIVRVDGSEFELVNGGITITNLPSFYDVEVFAKVEENHIPKPVIIEPIPEPEP
ncbi:MAG: hypothetical protein LCH52_03825 [Bacteroidetes bacterium]|nr:hypothetical protein [Bacteroidota bacterium]